MKNTLLCLSLSCLVPAVLLGGVKMKMETKGTSGSVEQTGWIYLEGENWLRMDPDTKEGAEYGDNSIVFRADLETLYIIDHKRREFMGMNRETMEEMTNQINEAMRQMNEQLKNMPEAQRKMMEKMMKDRMPQAAEKIQVDVRDKGQEDGLNKYEVWIDEEKQSEVWTAPPEELNLPEDSIRVFERMADFYEGFIQSLSSNPMIQPVQSNPFAGMRLMTGFPVRILDVQESRDTRITIEERLSLGETLFQPPSNYKERSLKFR